MRAFRTPRGGEPSMRGAAAWEGTGEGLRAGLPCRDALREQQRHQAEQRDNRHGRAQAVDAALCVLLDHRVGGGRGQPASSSAVLRSASERNGMPSANSVWAVEAMLARCRWRRCDPMAPSPAPASNLAGDQDNSEREHFWMLFDDLFVGMRYRNFKVLTHLIEFGSPNRGGIGPHLPPTWSTRGSGRRRPDALRVYRGAGVPSPPRGVGGAGCPSMIGCSSRGLGWGKRSRLGNRLGNTQGRNRTKARRSGTPLMTGDMSGPKRDLAESAERGRTPAGRLLIPRS